MSTAARDNHAIFQDGPANLVRNISAGSGIRAGKNTNILSRSLKKPSLSKATQLDIRDGDKNTSFGHVNVPHQRIHAANQKERQRLPPRHLQTSMKIIETSVERRPHNTPLNLLASTKMSGQGSSSDHRDITKTIRHGMFSDINTRLGAVSGDERSQIISTEALLSVSGKRVLEDVIQGNTHSVPTIKKTMEELRAQYHEEFYTSPREMSLQLGEWNQPKWDRAKSMLTYTPLTKYPPYQRLILHYGKSYENKEQLNNPVTHEVPLKSVPEVHISYIREMMRPAADGGRLCINANKCWLYQRKKYVGQVFLLPNEFRDFRRTGRYPQPPISFRERQEKGNRSTDALRQRNTMNYYYAPCSFGKCVACIMNEISYYLLMMSQRQQTPPSEPINPFCVIIGPGEFRSDSCWSHMFGKYRPSGIIGKFPSFDDGTVDMIDTIAQVYTLHHNRINDSPTKGIGTTKALHTLLFKKEPVHNRQTRSLRDQDDEIFSRIRTYEQLQPDGVSTITVQATLPRIHMTLANVDF